MYSDSAVPMLRSMRSAPRARRPFARASLPVCLKGSLRPRRSWPDKPASSRPRFAYPPIAALFSSVPWPLRSRGCATAVMFQRPVSYSALRGGVSSRRAVSMPLNDVDGAKCRPRRSLCGKRPAFRPRPVKPRGIGIPSRWNVKGMRPSNSRGAVLINSGRPLRRSSRMRRSTPVPRPSTTCA